MNNNYLVAVLSDRIQAESAYTLLEKQGLPLSKITILGRGYKSADEFGLIDPNEIAQKQAKLMAIWLIPFGFIAGVGFSLATSLQTFAWAGEIGNHVVGGFLGAIGGAMGSVFIGGGGGIAFGSGDSLPYRNRINAGKYLIVVEGSQLLIQQATTILRKFDPENIQSYIDMYQ
ncbi:hypothetical protein [Chamaesiphon sp. VAR_48_metabat_135_sub]|uniref:hypothetical protein n=1 Tax=Chamaesiphon sp. VAR_48_metabat_135_sub TaxID=2964699 RepID=UPI00286A873C|nr:hypothetical protein [Chamaesiphon sp. VAR_48_metabat_135_sub]